MSARGVGQGVQADNVAIIFQQQLTLSYSGAILGKMRDDRYQGTSLSRPVRKLCLMAEREADRVRPDRLREQAVAALISDADREISPDFRRRLRDHSKTPGLFSANEIVTAARTGLETEIARNIDFGNAVDPTDAVRDALRRRGEGYVREQKCALVADRHPYATLASEGPKKAFEDGAPIAATLILTGQSPPNKNNRVQLTENLLARPASGVGR
jgi:hypothetical protein